MSSINPPPSEPSLNVATESTVKDLSVLCSDDKENSTSKESNPVGEDGSGKKDGVLKNDNEPELTLEQMKKDADGEEMRGKKHLPRTRSIHEKSRKAVDAAAVNSLLDSSDSDKLMQLKKRWPCQLCSVTCCSNCLVPFKNGDKMITKIPSRKLDEGGKRKSVSIESALIDVFESHNNPYPMWVKSMEKGAELLTHLVDILIDRYQFEGKLDEKLAIGKKGKDSKKELMEKPTHIKCRAKERERLHGVLSVILDEIENDYWEHRGIKPENLYVELARKRFNEIQIPTHYLPTPDEVKAFMAEKLKQQAMMEKNRKRSAKSIYETIKTKAGMQELLDIKLCVGCAEVLTILFTALENLQANKLSMDSYYYAVMVGFRNAKKAQDVIFRPSESSKVFIFDKYGKESHPIGCQQRCTKQGIKFSLGTKKRDLIKNAVGNLHGHLEEIHRRIRYELIRRMEADPEYVCDVPDVDDVGIEEQELELERVEEKTECINQ